MQELREDNAVVFDNAGRAGPGRVGPHGDHGEHGERRGQRRAPEHSSANFLSPRPGSSTENFSTKQKFLIKCGKFNGAGFITLILSVISLA